MYICFSAEKKHHPISPWNNSRQHIYLTSQRKAKLKNKYLSTFVPKTYINIICIESWTRNKCEKPRCLSSLLWMGFCVNKRSRLTDQSTLHVRLSKSSLSWQLLNNKTSVSPYFRSKWLGKRKFACHRIYDLCNSNHLVAFNLIRTVHNKYRNGSIRGQLHQPHKKLYFVTNGLNVKVFLYIYIHIYIKCIGLLNHSTTSI